MSNDTVLNVDDLAQEIRRVDGKHDLGAGRLAEALMPFIEQAVLQSPEIQALRKDVAMLDWLDSTNAPFKMGWNVGLAPAGNVSVSSVIQLGGSVTPIRSAIDAAMEKQP